MRCVHGSGRRLRPASANYIAQTHVVRHLFLLLAVDSGVKTTSAGGNSGTNPSKPHERSLKEARSRSGSRPATTFASHEMQSSTEATVLVRPIGLDPLHISRQRLVARCYISINK